MNTLGIDVGLKRIGLALCVNDKIVMPIDGILRKNRNQAANDIKKIIQEYKIEKLVVGIPKDGSSQEQMQKRIEYFVSLLEFHKEVIFYDESFSSKNAKDLHIANLRKKDAKLDSLAAFLFLKDYFGL